jgi:predicted aspartyl protease
VFYKQSVVKARVLLLGLALAGLTTGTSVSPVHSQANTDFIEGTKLYARKQYRPALAKFQQTLKAYPSDGSTYYYMGACYQQLRDLTNAKRCYADAIKYGKSQPPGVNALTALLAIDVEYAKSVVPAWNWKLQKMLPGGGRFGNPDGSGPMPTASAGGSSASSRVQTYSRSAPSSSGQSATDASLPAEGKFIIVDNPLGNNMTYVSATINGRPVNHMLFDTGAEMVLFGRNHLQELNITPPSGPPTSEVRGVGGTQQAWRMQVDLKVGNIERRNFTITVQERMDAPPLLGQTFFKDYQCHVDKAGRQIRLVRTDVYKSSIASATPYGNANNVPFTRQGNLVVVKVEINGRPTSMCLDTGASNTQFTKEQLAQVNVTVPQDVVIGSSSGIGGSTATVQFPVNRVKMGPIDKTNFPIQVVQKAAMPYPLLGQDFFGDWRFSIDTVNNAIKFQGRSSN